MTIPDFLPLVELWRILVGKVWHNLKKVILAAKPVVHTYTVDIPIYFSSDGCYMVDSLSYANSSHCEKSPIHAAC